VGESVLDPRKYFHNNVQNGLALVNAAMDAGVRYFIFSSSCAVYGTPEKVPITEDTRCQPVNPYGETKLFFERVLDAYSRAYGLRTVALRYFNAAGADESGEIGELHHPRPICCPWRWKLLPDCGLTLMYSAMTILPSTAPAFAITSTSPISPRGTRWPSNSCNARATMILPH